MTELTAADGRTWQVPSDRLQQWHMITIKATGWHLVHDIECDLATCPFDQVAQTWAVAPRVVGTYCWLKSDDSAQAWTKETTDE